jgi:hypothetical protein
MTIQSVLFYINYFTLNNDYEWIGKHGFEHHKIDITRNKYKFRQEEPDPTKIYFIIKVTNRVQALLINISINTIKCIFMIMV